MGQRSAGVSMGISNFPGSLGIGDLGEDSYEFIDRLASSDVKVWHVHSLNPESAKGLLSSFAGDEVYISIESLYNEYQMEIDYEKIITSSVDFKAVRALKRDYLSKAYQNFKPDSSYDEFLSHAHWLEDYANYKVLRMENNTSNWKTWEKDGVDVEKISFEKFIQYIFFQQWSQVKEYAMHNNIKIVGTTTLDYDYVSCEVYNAPSLFNLNGKPENISINWEENKKDNYKLFLKKLQWNQELFDTIYLKSDVLMHSDDVNNYKALLEALIKQDENLNVLVETELSDETVIKLHKVYGMRGAQLVDLKDYLTSKEECDVVYMTKESDPSIGDAIHSMRFYKRLSVLQSLRKSYLVDKNIIDRMNHYILNTSISLVVLSVEDIIRSNRMLSSYPDAQDFDFKISKKLSTLEWLDEGFKNLKSWIELTNRK